MVPCIADESAITEASTGHGLVQAILFLARPRTSMSLPLDVIQTTVSVVFFAILALVGDISLRR
jgi:hypothetical protein